MYAFFSGGGGGGKRLAFKLNERFRGDFETCQESLTGCGFGQKKSQNVRCKGEKPIKAQFKRASKHLLEGQGK